MSITRKIGALCERLRHSEHGVAAVEFALVLPIMLLVYVGSLEATALITMDRKVQTVSSTVGDLVAQTNLTLAKDTLKDYFRASDSIMSPYRDVPLEQTVTQVFVAANGDVKVVWSWDFKGDIMAVGTKYKQNTPFSLPAEMIEIARNSNVIVAEARTSYMPFYGIAINRAIDLRRDSYYLPRFGGAITVK